MNHAPRTTTGDHGRDFSPRTAAALLAQTTRTARHQFEPSPPWLLAVRAVVALGVYGSIWLSVRGQHPYQHPSAAAIPGAVACGVANVVATMAVAKRASAGIAGKARLRPADIAVAAAIWVAVLLPMVALAAAGVRSSLVYGLYPATAPVILAGLAWAAITLARADWRACATGVAAAAVGAVAVLAGPRGAWLVVGVGVFVLLLEHAAEIAYRQRV